MDPALDDGPHNQNPGQVPPDLPERRGRARPGEQADAGRGDGEEEGERGARGRGAAPDRPRSHRRRRGRRGRASGRAPPWLDVD